MSLAAYRRKRDFARTREPKGSAAKRESRPIFVVQLHHARRRHFDFRLQVGNVLKSWAVPKGPSFDPGVKRLAVEVEDHPLAYADFEGDIPEGNYGAGHVDCFDRGTWVPEGDPQAQLRKGHLEFSLYGERLHGRWHLVRSHRKERQPAWFLIKSQDAYAGDIEADDLLGEPSTPPPKAGPPRSRGKAAIARVPGKSAPRLDLAGVEKRSRATIDTGFFPPELAQLRAQVPLGDEWLHEVKWDGYRILTAVAKGEVACWSRNALLWNERIPAIVEAVGALGLRSARLDGELVAIRHGQSDFNALQKTLSGEQAGELSYVLFDLVHLNGYDISQAPLLQRKAMLASVLEQARGVAADRLRLSEHIVGKGDEVWQSVLRAGLEGVVSKRVDSAYRAGRGGDWLKTKRQDSDEFAVVGYTAGKGSRQGFGSLLLGRPSPQGGWDYAGRVGTGFSDAQLRRMGDALAARRGGDRPTVHASGIDPTLRGARWVKPEVVVEVYYRGIAGNGLLRQPSLKAVREDKRAGDLSGQAKTPTRRATGKRSPESASATALRGIDISHPEREVYPGTGIRKRDVAAYYDAVMDWFLPGVIDRPVSILRCPDGLGKPCFFQKHTMAGLRHAGSKALVENGGKRRVYLYLTDDRSVMELVQFGAVEFHPWGCRVDDDAHADRIVFDLDPGEGVSWERLQSAARLTRRWLDQLGLASFLRCTGGKGLHVVVPLRPAAPWAEAKAFAKAFATSMAQARPDEFIAVSTLARRRGLIFVDYLRNSRGATSIASYSLRARAGAPVAVPLRWSELGRIAGPAAFDIESAVQRLRRLRGDPWEGIDTVRQTLADAVRGLAMRRS